MGLFGLFGKNDDKLWQECDQLLALETAGGLTSAGVESFHVLWLDGVNELSCKDKWPISSLGTLRHRSKHKKTKDLEPGAYKLFSLAVERGSADAACFLGLMYEHGLTDETPMDQNKAEEYYSMARLRESALVKAIDQIRTEVKNVRRELTDDPLERFVACMDVATYDDTTEALAPVRQMLDEYEWGKFLWMKDYLLCFYASKGHPLSQSILAKHMYNYSKAVEQGWVHKESLGMWMEKDPDRKGRAISGGLVQKTLDMAQKGNVYAIACCKVKLGIDL